CSAWRPLWLLSPSSGLVVLGRSSRRSCRTIRRGYGFGSSATVPAASERLHQEHAGVHATAEDIDLVALVREGHGLGGDDLQVVVDPAPVAVREELERLLRRLHGAPLLLGLLLEDAESRQVVFDLLEGRERGLAV